MKRVVGFILICVLSGCASVSVSQEFSPYVGKPVGMAIMQYGPPQEQSTINGVNYYSWTVERSQPGAFPGFHSDCKVTFMADAHGIVTGYTVHRVGGLEASNSC